MTVFYKLAEFILLLTLTILLYFDFFPHPFLPNIFDKLFILIIILIVIVHNFISPYKEDKKKESFISHFGISFYLIFLLILFNIISGESQSDLTFENPLLWFACIFSLYLNWKNYRKKIKEIESGQV